MKKLLYIAVFISSLSTFTSCTTDELEPTKKPIPTTVSAKDGDVDPPIIIIKP